jgi:hypothetical protein
LEGSGNQFLNDTVQPCGRLLDARPRDVSNARHQLREQALDGQVIGCGRSMHLTKQFHLEPEEFTFLAIVTHNIQGCGAVFHSLAPAAGRISISSP